MFAANPAACPRLPLMPLHASNTSGRVEQPCLVVADRSCGSVRYLAPGYPSGRSSAAVQYRSPECDSRSCATSRTRQVFHMDHCRNCRRRKPSSGTRRRCASWKKPSVSRSRSCSPLVDASTVAQAPSPLARLFRQRACWRRSRRAVALVPQSSRHAGNAPAARRCAACASGACGMIHRKVIAGARRLDRPGVHHGIHPASQQRQCAGVTQISGDDLRLHVAPFRYRPRSRLGNSRTCQPAVVSSGTSRRPTKPVAPVSATMGRICRESFTWPPWKVFPAPLMPAFHRSG